MNPTDLSPACDAEASGEKGSSLAEQRSSSVLDLLPEICFITFVLVFTTVRLIEEHVAFVRAPGADWNSSEWMITYAEGFVRRGLGGELLVWLMHFTGLGFFPIWATVTTAVYLAVCWYILRRCHQLRGSNLWRFCLLMNPALLIFPIECRPYGSFLRKEVLFVAGTVALVSLCEWALRGSRLSSAAGSVTVLLSFCAVSTVLALLHEGMFLFGWFPLNAVVLVAFLRRRRVGLRVALGLALIASLPALAVTGASGHWHGTAQTAKAICENWHSESVSTVCNAGRQFPPAVGALGWSVADAIALPMKAAWRFPVFLMIFAFVAALLLSAIRKLMREARLEHLIALMVLPLVCSLPIFVLGWDWGRYLFMVMGQQLCVMLSEEPCPAVYEMLPTALLKVVDAVTVQVKKPLEAFAKSAERVPALLCLVLLVLPVPGVPPERTMFKGSPPVIVYDFARSFPAGADYR